MEPGVFASRQRVVSLEESVGGRGVAFLAVGRLLDAVLVARVGAVFVLMAALAFTAILGRKLHEIQVAWTPIHTG